MFPDRKHIEQALAKITDSKTPFSSLQLFYTSHYHWPFAPVNVGPSKHTLSSTNVPSIQNENVHVCVLDSSFNPPTKAHFKMSLSSYPGPVSISEIKDQSSPQDQTDEKYTARLLLLSARNVDKVLKPGDATFAQRIEMMILQAQEMEKTDPRECNVAVGALNFPTFVGKSLIIKNWLKNTRIPSLSGDHPLSDSEVQMIANRVKLTFLIGSDTLTRLFAAKYYTRPESTDLQAIGDDLDQQLNHFFNTDQSNVVCVRRYDPDTANEARQQEELFVQADKRCKALVEKGQIRFAEEEQQHSPPNTLRGLGKGEEMGAISSTRVRQAVKDGNDDLIEQLCGDSIHDYVVEQGLYK